jgi:PAS domain S-box-containing protein
MKLLQRFSILCAVAIIPLAIVLCFLVTVFSSFLDTNLAIFGTILAGFGIFYILLFGTIRRANRLIDMNKEELRQSREKIQFQRMELIKRIGALALGGADLDIVLREAAGDICGLLDLQRCAIRLFGEPGKVIEHRAPDFPSFGFGPPDSRLPADEREVCEKGDTLVVNGAGEGPHNAGSGDASDRIRLGAYIVVPLRIREERIGLLFLERSESHGWTEDEVATAETMARQVAVAIVHARLFSSRQELSGRLLSLMNNVPGIVYRGHRDWSISLIGAEVEAVTGYTAGEFLDGTIRWKELIHPEDLGPIKDLFRQAARAREKVLRKEYRIRHRDGSYRWIADRRQLLYDAQGELLYVDGLILDITRRKKSEETLRLTQFAVDRAGDAGYWIDREGRLIYVNEQMCRVLGYSREELLSMTIHDINPAFPAEVWPSHWENLRRRKTYTFESQHRSKDGGIIPVEVTVNYMGFDGKEYNCASARDIRKRKEAQEKSHLLEAQLLHAQKMEAIGSLAGGIAHDFNNLLTGILGYSNLLKFKAEPGSEVYKAADVILDAADRASHLTAQLLGFARKGKNLAVPVDIHRTIDGVARLLERTLDKRIRIRKLFTKDTVAVIGDPTQLQQFLMNLAVNARDAMPEGGELSVSTAIAVLDRAFCETRPGVVPGKYVRIEVSDTGTGISKDHIEKIFDPFFTTKGQGHGSGLGLSMVFGIVQNHGGTIEVESEVGAGTLFMVYLPLADGGTEKEEPPRTMAKAEAGAARGKILLIDDQDTVREVCSAMLATLGYKVSTAADGREGVEYYRRFGNDVDLVIIDMIMPILGGRDCFRELKAMNPGVRAILSTGFSMDGTVQEIMDEGIIGFIQKPYRLEELSNVVSKAIGRDN